ncbi:TrmH family RNA methyltransferase [Herpetosiphon llansteffanensis]|uniref:TrmH family RNA methyltransferase n=1 Tax=Herpetosiphon llansteffanensis TaxID=2094568 RepID=UPI000D7CABBF|nr:RNA methyltransferase [Herpetosiphon llansteffanensis]
MLTSRNNPTIKQIRALRQRREREATGLFFIEGIRNVTEATQAKAPIEQLIVAPDLLRSQFAQELVEQQRQQGTPILDVSSEVFASLSSKDGPQGLAAVIRQQWASLNDVTPDQGLCWIALNAISDPGNLGTILRTGDAVGATGVILLGDCTDPYDPATGRASMGTLFSQRLVKASWAEFRQWLGQSGFNLVGAADSASSHYRSYRYPQPLILLMGSEREGLDAEQQAQCQALVSLPMHGKADSLNLAVATGVLLYEILAQADQSAANKA